MGTHQLPQQTAALSSALYSPTITIITMKFAICLAFFLLGLAMVMANDSAATATVVGATATGLVASPGTDVTKTITITSTKTVEQNTNLRKGVVRITTIPTVIPTVVPTTTPVSFIGYADWTSAASSLTPFSFFAHLF